MNDLTKLNTLLDEAIAILNALRNQMVDEAQPDEPEIYDLDKLKAAALSGHGLSAHGIIFKVNIGFYGMIRGSGSGDNPKYRDKYIKKGALIEFRYEHSAHCRDVDNDYWMIDPVVLAFKCTPFGRIKENVNFGNKNNLQEILDQRLYNSLLVRPEAMNGETP